MKSIFHIAAFLVLQFCSIAYSQNNTEFKTDTISADTSYVKSMLQNEKKISVADSLNTSIDSLGIVSRDTIEIDSVHVRFLPGLGQMLEETDSLDFMHQNQFVWSDAKVISDLLWKIPGFFYRDLGEAGKWGQLNAYGTDGRDIGIFLDGRPMKDPVTGTYNLSDLPLEFLDHAEILSAAGAIPLSSDATGASINFISRSYNNYRALTKLRFVQDPKGTLLTDGLFTQNIARGLNLMIGFTRQVSEGRYLNADMDAWNIRTRLRYNISDRLNISLTDFYTKAANGLNGGVQKSNSKTFDEAAALVVNNNAWDKRFRRDVTLSAIARLLPDSASKTQAHIYYTTTERKYCYSKSLDDFILSVFWGIQLRQQVNLDFIKFTAGGSWERRKSDSTRVMGQNSESENSLFANAELELADIFIPNVSVRTISIGEENSLSTGAGFKSKISDWLGLSAETAWYDRFPTLQEKFWKDSSFSRTGEIRKEQHYFLRGGLTLQLGSSAKVNLEGFKRNIENAVIYLPAKTAGGSPAVSICNIPKLKIQGFNGSLNLHFYKFELNGFLTLTDLQEVDTLKTFLPDLIIAGELTYRDTFFKDKLDAKFGLRSRFYNRQNGMQFDPQTLAYLNYGQLLGRSTTIDLFAILKIGDAHLTVSWQNILDASYMLSPVYPMPGRFWRLGVNWVFTD